MWTRFSFWICSCPYIVPRLGSHISTESISLVRGSSMKLGMASGDAISSRMSAMGLGLIDPWQGLAAMEAAAQAARPSIVAFWLVRWDVMLGPGKKAPALLAGLAPRVAAPRRRGYSPTEGAAAPGPTASRASARSRHRLAVAQGDSRP